MGQFIRGYELRANFKIISLSANIAAICFDTRCRVMVTLCTLCVYAYTVACEIEQNVITHRGLIRLVLRSLIIVYLSRMHLNNDSS